jgi:predicted solute-binding protein
MNKIIIIFISLAFLFSSNVLAQEVEELSKKGKEEKITNPLGINQILKNYEKKGIKLTTDQKAEAMSLAMAQVEKMEEEKKEMKEEMNEEEMKSFWKSHKATLRKSIHKDVMTSEQMASLKVARQSHKKN